MRTPTYSEIIAGEMVGTGQCLTMDDLAFLLTVLRDNAEDEGVYRFLAKTIRRMPVKQAKHL